MSQEGEEQFAAVLALNGLEDRLEPLRRLGITDRASLAALGDFSSAEGVDQVLQQACDGKIGKVVILRRLIKVRLLPLFSSHQGRGPASAFCIPCFGSFVANSCCLTTLRFVARQVANTPSWGTFSNLGSSGQRLVLGGSDDMCSHITRMSRVTCKSHGGASERGSALAADAEGDGAERRQATGNSAADRGNSKKQSELIRSWVRDSLGQCECFVPFEPAPLRITLTGIHRSCTCSHPLLRVSFLSKNRLFAQECQRVTHLTSPVARSVHSLNSSHHSPRQRSQHISGKRPTSCQEMYVGVPLTTGVYLVHVPRNGLPWCTP